MAFEELGVVTDGIIVARTDSLGAGLTEKIPVSTGKGDHASEYNKWLDTEPVLDMSQLKDGDVALDGWMVSCANQNALPMGFTNSVKAPEKIVLWKIASQALPKAVRI